MVLFLKLRRFSYIVFINITNFLLGVVPFNLPRSILLKLVGVKLGNGTKIERGVRLDFPWRLIIGKNCHIGKFVYLDCRGGSITVGDDSDISEGAIIYTLSHDIQSEDFFPKCGDVVIGNRNWICARSIVLPGAYLGAGNVLGANSVFSGASCDFELLMGVPAISVKKLLPTRASRVR